MDCQFEKVTIPCLSCVVEEYQMQELTQEMRLNDGLPDIGRVIGAWGQVIMRSKEWITGTAKITGGVMATVLYAPEDGSTVRNVETWIPFQIQWSIPETDLDGSLCIVPGLRFIDGRMSGARKIMVRAGVYALLDAFCPSEQILFLASKLPEDIQIHKSNCTGRVPKETGEKTFLLDDEVRISVPDETPVKVLHYYLQPIVMDSRVMTDKIVFRGTVVLHLIYKREDERLYCHKSEMPFSQFAELSGTYSPDAKVHIYPVITNIELGENDSKLIQLKCSMVAQYVVDELETINVIEDAYSTNGELNVHTQMFCRDVVMNDVQETISPELDVRVIDGTIVDIVSTIDPPRLRNTDEGWLIEHSGMFKALYYDKDDLLQTTVGNWNETTDIPNKIDGLYQTMDIPLGEVLISARGDESVLSTQIRSDRRIVRRCEIPYVSGYEKMEIDCLAEQKPSLVICKLGEDTLWSIAKRYKSTISDIERANHLDENNKPMSESLLLIPIPQ